MTAESLSWDEFAARLESLAPGGEYTPDTRLAEIHPYRRVRLTRWLADFFVQPTALEVVEQFSTLGEAFSWLRSALESGEQMRDGRATESGSGESTRVRLRPILDHDIVPLYLASFAPATAGQWRYRGRTLPMDQFVSTLFSGTIAQFMVEMVETGTVVGLVSAYDENRSGLNCKLAFLRCGDRVPGDSAAVFEGMALFISYIFDNFPFRKLFAEVPAYNMGLFASDFAEEEGVLKDYLFYKGEYADLHHVSIRRETWAKLAIETGW